MMPSTRPYGVLHEVELESNLHTNSHPGSTLPIDSKLIINGSPRMTMLSHHDDDTGLDHHLVHRSQSITTKQKLYVLGMQGVGSGLVNFIINLFIAYMMFHTQPGNIIAYYGTLTCVMSDVIVTAFLIPCLTGIIGTALIHNDLRIGKLISPIDRRYLDHTFFRVIPTGQSWTEIVKRSILFGFIGVIVFAPVTLIIIYLCTGTGGMRALWSYVAFKGYWSGIVAMVLSPIIAFIAIAQDHPGQVQYTCANMDTELADLDSVTGEHHSVVGEHHEQNEVAGIANGQAGNGTDNSMMEHMIGTVAGDFTPHPNEFSSSSLGPSYIVT